jgi:predicted TIM-barrel fold metal-dependent hydrolase
MNTQVKTSVIDSDSHVIETERTWSFMTEEEQAFKPLVLVPKDGSAGTYWLIEGRAFRSDTNQSEIFPTAARELSDIKVRLAHMDEMGVDIHVLYPSIFLRPLSVHPEVDTALARSYNRWLAEIFEQAKGRLRWAMIPPLMQMDAAIAELHFAKEHGACGVFMRGIERHGRMSDPYIFPLYEEAAKLDMPITFHAGNGNFDHYDLHTRDFGFTTFKLPVVGAFHDLIMKGIPAKFPDLRWVFVEVSSQWIPYAMNDLGIRFRRQDRSFPGKELLRQNNIYVACQTTDDFDYVFDHVGDDNILLGTDYGHNDTATELYALRDIGTKSAADAGRIAKILSDNPKRAYSL